MTSHEQRENAPRNRSLRSVLDREEIAAHTDETDPLPDEAVLDLTWAREDAAHAGTVAAAAQGDLTPAETLEDVATSLGYRERTLDEDDYDR